MHQLNKEATAIFLAVTAGIDSKHQSKKIDNTNGAYMPLSIDFVDEWTDAAERNYKIIALAHNYVQNGDLMADPDMEFLIVSGNDISVVYPMTYQQDGLAIFQRAIVVDEKREIRFNARMVRELASFTAEWMRNIKHQQGIEITKEEKPVYHMCPHCWNKTEVKGKTYCQGCGREIVDVITPAQHKKMILKLA